MKKHDDRPKTDRDWSQRLRERDTEALEWLFDRHFREVHGLVVRAVQAEHLAEDLTQEIFVKVYESLPSYDVNRPLGPWLHAIVRNRIRDHWRSLGRPDAGGASLDSEDAPEVLDEQADEPLARIERTELEHELGEAVQRLPRGMRRTVEMRAFHGLSFEDVARRLNRTTIAVRKRYSRALQLLREDLGEVRLAS